MSQVQVMIVHLGTHASGHDMVCTQTIEHTTAPSMKGKRVYALQGPCLDAVPMLGLYAPFVCTFGVKFLPSTIRTWWICRKAYPGGQRKPCQQGRRVGPQRACPASACTLSSLGCHNYDLACALQDFSTVLQGQQTAHWAVPEA